MKLAVTWSMEHAKTMGKIVIGKNQTKGFSPSQQ